MQTSLERNARKGGRTCQPWLEKKCANETRFYVQEENTVEDVEEWIPSVAAVGLEWLFLCHVCFSERASATNSSSQ